ncbi:uncharacterized protein LOC115634148 [Scaptodrosophila lebanonensis]|uniref:Uncharacterized protein LOC115634148 n=1 Tax=Drosophila lebanonensis TaxID=7225 RepID=A0A6J2UGJ0_DROLE|nr:uncharacterized protein LOC115634148 [Scaptodrosophila lebanonensis]
MALWCLLPLITIVCCTLGAQARVCSGTPAIKDDRIVFPEDDDYDKFEKFVVALNGTSPSPIDETTTLLPAVNSTAAVMPDLALNKTNANTTAESIPLAFDNRIALDSLPKCGPGLELRAGRCRKSA